MDITIFLVAVGLSAVTVVADSMLKKATIIKPGTEVVILVLLGALIFGLTAFGWFRVLQKIELLNAAVIYTLSYIILIALVSIFYFKERLLAIELLALIMAIASMVILYRFH